MSPQFLSHTLDSWYNLHPCLHNLLKINPRLESLSFGRSNLAAWDALKCRSNPRIPFATPFPGGEDQWRRLLGSIKRLYLPVMFQHYSDAAFEQPASNMQMLVSHTTATLTHLDLDTVLYSSIPHSRWNISHKVKPLLAKILGSTPFERLTSIVLRGWLFSLQDLETFLLAHASTLRDVHLINCCLAEASESEFIESISSKLQPALTLTGVEIYAILYESQCSQLYTECTGRQVGDDPSSARKIRNPFPNHIYPPCGPTQGKPELRIDLEKHFLAGKPNNVVRVAQPAIDDENRFRWLRELIGDYTSSESEFE
jgi:hypothetical protein